MRAPPTEYDHSNVQACDNSTENNYYAPQHKHPPGTECLAPLPLLALRRGALHACDRAHGWQLPRPQRVNAHV
jgi:hypothetical protein